MLKASVTGVNSWKLHPYLLSDMHVELFWESCLIHEANRNIPFRWKAALMWFSHPLVDGEPTLHDLKKSMDLYTVLRSLIPHLASSVRAACILILWWHSVWNPESSCCGLSYTHYLVPKSPPAAIRGNKQRNVTCSIHGIFHHKLPDRTDTRSPSFNFQNLFSHVRKIIQRNVPPLTFSFNGTQGEEGVEYLFFWQNKK